MSAETPVQSAGYFTHARLRFRAWRGARPFWAGLFTLLGGVPIAYFPYATLKLGTMSVAMATTAEMPAPSSSAYCCSRSA